MFITLILEARAPVLMYVQAWVAPADPTITLDICA
jgi:hypothetical protein